MAKKKQKIELGPQTRYPWRKWLDGKKHILNRFKDFQCTTKTMTVYVYATARRHGRKVHVHELEEGKLQIQAHDGNGKKK